ncbi:Plant specific eukaryotic initiation factor 4B [Arabidopsis suecica]|uniref:Plant specific eukaryotic initiation factor 4B n=1 Tax=Arabidopsis suecica TaxID=45249 RepID=A0A8T1YEH1_ARASU|nr:Plant specific eukaryotic initiation factor 4B [Arabidopsis suecica]
MAAAVSSVWAKPGAWALEAEEHEAELKQQAPPSTQKSSAGDSSDFPSLAAAATTKTKKKKGQTISLAEFATYGSAKAAPAPQTERLTQAELVSLPTGPRERSAEELDRSKLGGGFRSYGGGRYGDESSSSRWGSSRVSEDGERRGGGFNRDREPSRDSGPSRADEDDNWAAAKKPIGGGGFERRERGGGGGFFESQSQSKADEVDSWVSTKPSEPRRFVSSNGGGDRFEKRGSFESLSRNRDSQYGGGGSSDSDTWGRRREESSGANGVPSPTVGSRPRLVLQPRTLPVAVVEVVKPESPVLVIVDKPKGANPFGNARPREEVLAEKGQDWKEIDEKLEADKLKDVAAAIEKPDEKSPGKMGFGLGNGRKDDERTERSWRKSTEQSEEEPAVEEAKKEEAEGESAVEEAKKEETEGKPAVEEAKKEETENEPAVEEAKKEETEDKI